MIRSPKQKDVICLNFSPSKGYEIQQPHPALVLSRTEYNQKTNLVIVCPITSNTVLRHQEDNHTAIYKSDKHPYMIKIIDYRSAGLEHESLVNPIQMYSLDYRKRDFNILGSVSDDLLFRVWQQVLLNFNLPQF
ncbi:mRNA interferase PemK [Lentilactobacillus fungorum]|jgi:mRNA interferase MazF|uniref:mRNA interferase PemK n=1 Tax=Lentilactobacillus fungorum TaxID=2201250 RepID=A0ABQ3VY69_9LACO|nr:type II toxin-antitoxin system PemK/MazF family toxin [Lentilactobacillus fungorum]GHP13386.1 mRNA interferase PemK [Lentilactobacillus fungorum]